ncbi:MAG: DUF3267 domain-containing protein [Clostridiaceae bacterium]|nr:DUF3267 domain-containing protein [Clostridiaceae bacterium]
MVTEAFSQKKYTFARHTIGALRVNLLAFIVSLPFAVVYIAVYAYAYPRISHFTFFSSLSESAYFIPFFFIMFFLVLFTLVTAHEVIHAIIFVPFCIKKWRGILFRFRLLTPYAHCTEAIPIRAFQFAMIAPALFLSLPISILSVVWGSPFSFLITLIIIFSSGGDFVALILTLRHRVRGTFILDEPDSTSYSVYIPKKNSMRIQN